MTQASRGPMRDSGAPALLGVILAGGEGRRMGGAEKALLRLGGRTLLARVAVRLAPQLAGGARDLALSANGPQGRYAAAWEEIGLHAAATPPQVRDAQPLGPLAGLLAGLEHAAARGAPAVVTVAVDTPFFPETLVADLSAAAGENGAACAATDALGGARRDHPTFGIWPTALRHDLAEALQGEGVRRMSDWVARCGCARAVYPQQPEPGADAFFNVNTQGDMRLAEVRLQAQGRSIQEGEPSG
ncbi:MAG: molybdenum cofactor guanylyltransferase MobA [Pseudomonadota bacterium]